MRCPRPTNQCPLLSKQSPGDKPFDICVTSAELSKSVDKLHPSSILFDVIYRSIDRNFDSFSLSELLEIDIDGKKEVVWPRAFQTLSKAPHGLLLCFIPRYFDIFESSIMTSFKPWKIYSYLNRRFKLSTLYRRKCNSVGKFYGDDIIGEKWPVGSRAPV